MDEIAAVPAATSVGYGDAVTDEEFEEWVKRSQADTDAALEEWDTSVQFDQLCNGQPAPLDFDQQFEGDFDDDVIEARIVEPGDTDYTPLSRLLPRRSSFAELAARIRRGEEIGPEARAAIEADMRVGRPLGTAIEVEIVEECDDPGCRCHQVDTIRAREVPSTPWEVLATSGMLGPFGPIAAEVARMRRGAIARRNVEALGLVVVDDAAGPRASGLVLPSDDVVTWAKREFGVIPPADISPGYSWRRG